MKTLNLFAAVAALLLVAGCGDDSATTTDPDALTTIDGSAYLLSDEPEGAEDVIAVRESAKDGDDVLIVGRIGGNVNPWIEGRAAFTIVDVSLVACNDIPGDNCPKPWDYCCDSEKLPASTVLVKVLGEEGNLIKADARQLLNVKELSTVVVQGKAERDGEGNLTVIAAGVYVKS